MKGIKVFVGRVMLVALFALAASLVLTGGAWAAQYQKGAFTVTTDKAESALEYTSGGQTYGLQGWESDTRYRYTTNGVLTIKESGTYRVSMSGGTTTDRIKIAEGTTVNLTISGLNIAPNKTDGQMAHYGQGRPFDMKKATVNLTLEGTNKFKAPSFNTALFCPANSNLKINDNGTLNVEIITSDFAVAGIGGEGKVNPQFTKDGYPTITDKFDQLSRIRQWSDDEDSRCGNITIEGSPKVNVLLQIGDPQPTYNPDDVLMEHLGTMKNCVLVPPKI